MLKRARDFAIALSLSLICAVPVFGGIITASSAGPLPGSAQDLTGDQYLSEIVGVLDYPDGVSLFKINLVQFEQFSAMTVLPIEYGVPDTELFLFDASGRGVYMNDDDNTSGTTLSCLPSASFNPCASAQNGLGPAANGFYYLGITRAANLPLSASGEIFSPLLTTDVTGPDLTLGGGDPIIGWDNGVYTGPDFDNVNYDIVLNGTAVPEPGTAWFIAGIVLLPLMVLRKRRSTHIKT